MTAAMLIRLTKGRDKRDSLTCRQPDGTSTWAPCPGPAQHDLVHYAVETILGLNDSFYALISRGYDIGDFSIPAAAQALQLPLEARQTEFVVGLFQSELASGVEYDDFVGEVRNACVVAKTPPPDYMKTADVPHVRSEIQKLLRSWEGTRPGGFVELTFPASSPTAPAE